MADVRWSLSAADDLESIENYVARDSVAHAIRFVDRLIESAETLADAPRRGRVVPEYRREELRELICRGYRVVYRLQDDVVTVLRVVHGARDLVALFRGEPWAQDE